MVIALYNYNSVITARVTGSLHVLYRTGQLNMERAGEDESCLRDTSSSAAFASCSCVIWVEPLVSMATCSAALHRTRAISPPVSS